MGVINNVLIYGGAFDPPHNGHLNTAIAVQNHFHFDRFIFLPSKTPVLKNPSLASCEQRLEMLNLAIKGHPEFEVDPRETTRDTPSFMVETLESFRQELGYMTSITLGLGRDAFLQLPKWHAWEKIISLCNILVIKRDVGVADEGKSLRKLVLMHETSDKSILKISPHGKIYPFDAGHYPISSSWIREQLKTGQDVGAYLPAGVYEYIKNRALYI